MSDTTLLSFILLAGKKPTTLPPFPEHLMKRLSVVARHGLAIALGLWLTASAAQAQVLRDQLMTPVDFKPVSFEPEVKESIGVFTSIANTVFKPAGPGPFPAVVLMHTCGGVRQPHIKQHAQELLAAGHVVLVTDSFEPRGVQNCAVRPVSSSVGIADAYAGLALLAGKPYVDSTRIFQVGYSWGAIVSTMLSSPQSASLAGSSLRFAGTIANYGNCSYQGKYQFLMPDADRPLLMLMGEKDDELPANTCFPLLTDLKAKGSPVEWHLFPEATHSWDMPSQPGRGFIYNAKVTAEAMAKLREFMARIRQ